MARRLANRIVRDVQSFNRDRARASHEKRAVTNATAHVENACTRAPLHRKKIAGQVIRNQSRSPLLARRSISMGGAGRLMIMFSRLQRCWIIVDRMLSLSLRANVV